MFRDSSFSSIALQYSAFGAQGSVENCVFANLEGGGQGNYVAFGDFAFVNNAVVGNTSRFEPVGMANRYNAYWQNSGGDDVGGEGNLAADPGFVDAAGADYRLGSGSPLIDAGDPGVLDADGSRSDVGAWGGPNGSW